MKNHVLFMALALGTALAMTSCKSSKKLTDAQATVADPAAVTEVATSNYTTPVTAAATTPRTTTTTTPAKSNASEQIVASEGTLQHYNVVVGAFGKKANANNYKSTMQGRGYNAFLVQNARGLWRVVAYTTNDYNAATVKRDEIRNKYANDDPGTAPKAWILNQ